MFNNFRMGKENDSNKKVKFIKPKKKWMLSSFFNKLKNIEIIKRGQLALLSVTLMVAVAGYINYKYNPEREKDLGKTVYVNSNEAGYEYNVDVYNDNNKTKETLSSEVTDNIIEQENIKKELKNKTEEVIAVFKYDRDNMFSELAYNYQNIISNESSSSESIKEAQEKLSKLLELKNQYTMVENIIKSKGINSVVIIVNCVLFLLFVFMIIFRTISMLIIGSICVMIFFSRCVMYIIYYFMDN